MSTKNEAINCLSFDHLGFDRQHGQCPFPLEPRRPRLAWVFRRFLHWQHLVEPDVHTIPDFEQHHLRPQHPGHGHWLNCRLCWRWVLRQHRQGWCQSFHGKDRWRSLQQSLREHLWSLQLHHGQQGYLGSELRFIQLHSVKNNTHWIRQHALFHIARSCSPASFVAPK